MDADQNTSQPDSFQPQAGPEVVKKTGARLESVQAEVVQLTGSSAELVNGTSVSLSDSTIRQVNGQSITIEDSPTGVVHGASLSVNNSPLGICSVSDANVNGSVGLMIGQTVTLNNHRSGLIITNEAHGGHIRSIVFLAGKTDAPVETLMDQRSVALLGLAGGVALGLVLSLFRFLRR